METTVNQPEISLYYTPRELANLLKFSLKAITKWTQARRILGQTKIGGSWRYRKADIEARLKAGGQFLLEKAHAR